MTRVVEHIRPVCMDAVRDFVETLPHLSADWDNTHDHAQKVALEMYGLEEALATGEGWMTWAAGKVDGYITIRPLQWDTDFFGMPMGIVDSFRSSDPEASGVLLHQLSIEAMKRGLGHLRHVVDVRDSGLIHSLQNSGWRYTWACSRFVCDTATTSHAPFSVSIPEVTVVNTVPEHLSDLVQISESLPPYSWPDFDHSLSPEARARYATTRLRNCVEGDFADRCFTLMHRDRPIGFNGSKIVRQPTRVPNPVACTVERDLFITADTIPGLGPAFQSEVVRRLSGDVRFMLGQVRLDGLSMLHTVQSAGFQPWGGSLYMVSAPG